MNKKEDAFLFSLCRNPIESSRSKTCVLVISQNLSMKKRFTLFSDKITKEEDELPHLGVSFF